MAKTKTAPTPRKTTTARRASSTAAAPATKVFSAREKEAAERIQHLRGCPADRLEATTSARPSNQGGGAVSVARCIDCGEQATNDRNEGDA